MRRGSHAFALSVLAALAACKPAPAPLTDADHAMARQMDSAMAVAAATGNTSAVMASYAPDAMVMPPNMPAAHGTSEIQKLWAGMSSQKATLRLTQQTADGAGDFMYTSGSYHIEMLPPNTGAEDGKYLEIFRRGADGTWKVVAYSWSADAPAAPLHSPAKPARRDAR